MWHSFPQQGIWRSHLSQNVYCRGQVRGVTRWSKARATAPATARRVSAQGHSLECIRPVSPAPLLASRSCQRADFQGGGEINASSREMRVRSRVTPVPLPAWHRRCTRDRREHSIRRLYDSPVASHPESHPEKRSATSRAARAAKGPPQENFWPELPRKLHISTPSPMENRRVFPPKP